MSNLQTFLLVSQIIVAVLLIIIVLLQKNDSDSLSGIGGSGGLNSVISSKSSANVLTKTTMFLVALFMINCLVLATISSNSQKQIQEELNKVADEQYKNNQNDSADVTKDKKNSSLEQNNKPAIPDIK